MTRSALGAITAIAAGAALAAPAQAGVLTKSATGCGTPEITQPFARWNDTANYKLVDGGAFEAATDGWSFTGGARVVDGNATQKVRGASDSRSLSLPAGSSATTPPVCVGLDEPTVRYFAKSTSLLRALTVSVQVQLQLGIWVTLPIGVDLGGAWHPSLPTLVVANLLPLFPPDQTAVRFVFRPLLGTFNVDDVFVDPRARS
jgi:hypothetical protein